MSAGKWKRRDARDAKYSTNAKPKEVDTYSRRHGAKTPERPEPREERWQ